MRYFVTGATGFIGRHLIDRLLAQGEAVRALVVEPTEIKDLRRRGVEVCFGDIGDPLDLTPDVADVDVVVHCAGAAPARMGLLSEQAWAVNVDGTERLLAASKQAAVKRFIFLSTSAVYRHSTPPIAEDAPIRPMGAYAQSKWAAEELVWRYHSQDGLPVVVLRPALVYGPGDVKFSQGIYRLAQLPFLPLPSGGERLLDLVYVSDLVDAILAAATAPAASGRAYNITDGQRHTVADLVQACGAVLGKSPAILPLPQSFLAAVPALVNGLSSGGRQTVVAGRLAGLKILDLDIHFAIDAARHDLDYCPKVGLQEGIEKTLNWQTIQTQASAGRASGNGHAVPNVRKSAGLYDVKMQGRLSQEYYGHSDFYNWGYWRSDTQTQKEASETLVDVLLDMLPHKQGTILDVACGMGATTRRLLKQYSAPQITGINLSDVQLRRAQENAPGVQFMLMNATELAFPDASFDNMICVEAAFHFNTRQQFLAEAHRVLTPGGALVLSDLLIGKVPGRRRGYFPSANYVDNLKVYEASFRKAGFREVQIIDATEMCWGGFRRNLLRWGVERFRQGEVRLTNLLAGLLYYAAAGAVIKYYPLVRAEK